MDDSLKKMIEDLISGKNEDAQTHFHSYVQDKMKDMIGESSADKEMEIKKDGNSH